MRNTLEEATEMIENLPASNANHCPDYDRRSRAVGHNKAIEDLTAKVDMLLKGQRRTVNMVEDQDQQEFVDEEMDDEDVNFLGGQRNFQNGGFN